MYRLNIHTTSAVVATRAIGDSILDNLFALGFDGTAVMVKIA